MVWFGSCYSCTTPGVPYRTWTASTQMDNAGLAIYTDSEMQFVLLPFLAKPEGAVADYSIFGSETNPTKQSFAIQPNLGRCSQQHI
ncbi:hypothetical protein XELAEV_18018597mg [Xenopus laevis]|uniref:Uncharacterized protein n=1 Tax=Xenopus laevis TaxID=8355 RepID=A0A974DF94_XENLA|nr:hypothetical protein XELAEV_18018597mg [Xenopus laevis]